MKTRFSLVLLLLIPGMAGAFEVKYAPEISSIAFLRWNVSKGPINMILNSAGSDDLLTGDVEKAVTRALLAWESITRQQIRFQYDGRNSIAVVNSTDNINSIVWEENDWDYADTSLAVTTYSYYLGDPPQVVDTDIQFNGRDFHWSVNGQNDEKTVDVQQVLMHELGHLLGLAHSSVVNASLYPYVGHEIRHKLSLDDRSGLRFLYGHRFSFHHTGQQSGLRGGNVKAGLTSPCVSLERSEPDRFQAGVFGYTFIRQDDRLDCWE